MDSQKLQLHLANKIEHPAVFEKDGKKLKSAARTETLVGFSNRGVRYRVLTPDELDTIQLNAAKTLGQEATGREIYTLALMYCVYEMVYEYTDPTDDPLAEKTKWHKASFEGFFANSPRWSSLFTAKDTQLLQAEYRRWHEVPSAQIEMLSGKAIAVAAPG